MSEAVSLAELVETFQNLLVSYATGGPATDAEFRQLRGLLLNSPSIGKKLPRFVRTCRDLRQFWGFIQQESPTYQGRRELIWDSFRPILEELEGVSKAPSDEAVTTILAKLDPAYVHEVWTKALDRRSEDPEGAITAARALLESVCKLILDDLGISYEEAVELPKLYRLVAKNLALAADEQSDEILRRVFGGCQSVVEGVAALRNRLSDSHGKGKQPIKPDPRHAELAVNLAGSMAMFLVATWEAKKA